MTQHQALDTTIPAALAALPRCPRRGLPIPYVNQHERDGALVADFTALHSPRVLQVARGRRCGLCGGRLGYWIGFLGGPGCAEQRTYLDPPMHPECAEAALVLCPHIAIAHARRATPARLHPDTGVPAGFVEDKPTTWVLGLTRDYQHGLYRHGEVVFFPAPFRHQHRWGYRDGQLLRLAAAG